MSRAIGMKADPIRLRRLGGGLGAATHAVSYADGTEVVLKRYRHGHEDLGRELAGLRIAGQAGLPTPELLAGDPDGAWFGSPALVMTKVDGKPAPRPGDPGSYVAQVAKALSAIHAVTLTQEIEELEAVHPVDRWVAPESPPQGLLDEPRLEALLSCLEAHLPGADRGGPVFNHGDFHPGNLLWRRRRLAAVIDWGFVRSGYRGWELSYFRVELAFLAGTEAADELSQRYWVEAGLPAQSMALWDLVCAYNAHRWASMWIAGYEEQGVRDLNADAVRRGVQPLVDTALRELRL